MKKFLVILVALIGFGASVNAQKFEGRYKQENGSLTISFFSNGSCIVSFTDAKYDATYEVQGDGSHRKITIVLKDNVGTTYIGEAIGNTLYWEIPSSLALKEFGTLRKY